LRHPPAGGSRRFDEPAPRIPGRRHGIRSGPAATVLAAALVSALVGACGSVVGEAPSSSSGGSAGPASSGEVITVFAAASLRNVMTAAASAYRSATGVRIVLSTDSSTALRVQIEQGAAVDVYLSADTRNPEMLAAEHLVDGTVVPFAGNQLAVVVPKANPAHLASPFDLARPGLTIIAAGDGVPITVYANQLVDRLAALRDAPPDFAAGYRANVATREDNVGAVLAKVELAEGDAGIVYSSDARSSPAVTSLAIPAGANVAATYEGAVPTSATRPSDGHAFLAWLTGPDGRAILASYGFGAPS
jgi:molybdate transport system substrate-binding protein